MLNDVRYAVRSLAKTPGVVLVIVLCLALGLGANTTIFALTNAVFLRPLPVNAPDRLVRVYSGWGRRPLPFIVVPGVPGAERPSRRFQRRRRVLARSRQRRPGRGDDDGARAIIASGNFFQVAGLRPAAGRFFTSAEDRVAGEQNVAVISHELWLQRYAANDGAIGRPVYINGKPFRIVGVSRPQTSSGSSRKTTLPSGCRS